VDKKDYLGAVTEMNNAKNIKSAGLAKSNATLNKEKRRQIGIEVW
jgi:hypothetical protein